MQRRKIQLVAGTTYALSLPKSWVQRHKLKQGDELTIQEETDATLLISIKDKKNQAKDISIKIDEEHRIEQVLFITYYLGYENIKLFSIKKFSKDTIKRIRKTAGYMSGTEITHEDTNSITIKILLDSTKVNINHVLYRIALLIESSFESILTGDREELNRNEDEIDRLYHLTSKIISLAMNDPLILTSAGIHKYTYIPQLLLISKRLENIGDTLLDIPLPKNPAEKQAIRALQEFFHSTTKIILKQTRDHTTEHAPDNTFRQVTDKSIQKTLETINRYIHDIHVEIGNLELYQQFEEETSKHHTTGK